MLKPTPARHEAPPRAARGGFVGVDAASGPAGSESQPRQVVPQPSRVLALAAADVALRDWDDLFHAVTARLAAMAEEGAACDIQPGLRQCVAALDQLQASLMHECTRNHQLELSFFDARTALARAGVEFGGSRADEQRSRRLALHDELTSLPNRSFFVESLHHALAQAEPLQLRVAVFCLDLDDFKPINDAHGRDVGDELLRIVASRLARALRAEDVVSRLGGDEFACLLSQVPGREQLSHLACKLFDAVSAPVKIGAHELTLRPSIGIATGPDDGVSAEALLRSADAAMVRAKRLRSGYAFFDRLAAA